MTVTPSDELRRALEAFDRGAWAEAHERLSAADRAARLGPGDLERLAVSAYLLGQDDEFVLTLDRAHRGHADAGERAPAARCAFWCGLTLLFRGQTGPATGWLARAGRLIEELDCVERGYLLLPAAEGQLRGGDFDGALATASEASSIGDRYGDLDLVASARHLEGRALIKGGRAQAGLVLLDEAMLSVTTGELSPMVTGLIYCSVIEACREALALGRAREWTSALAEWCDGQPDMVAFTAPCLVNRAEILRLQGAWPDAMAEARRACERRKPPAAAHYQRAELHRLRGELEAAEASYRDASRRGFEPQPGLALLRLAQDRPDRAKAAIHRVLRASTDPLHRARLLPAGVEVMLATLDLPEARAACAELDTLAGEVQTEALLASAAYARGSLELAEGEAHEALGSLRRALRVWEEIEAPYEAARARVRIARACRAVGDEDGCALELDAARTTFRRLGAVPDLADLDSLARAQPRDPTAPVQGTHGLSPRELEVLRLLSTGATNKAIAADLTLSERTVERHVSNIFGKLGVHTRAAATAYAYEHRLI